MKHKHMINACLFSLFLLISISISAQTFGVRGGLSSLSSLVEDDGEELFDDRAFLLGFQGGVQVDIPIGDNLSIETGLFLASKGLRTFEEEEIGGEPFSADFRINLLYLNLPILAKYQGAIGNQTIYGALGPFIGYAVDGTAKTKLELGDETEETSEDLNIGSGDEDGIKGLDAGLTIGAGVIINDNVQIGLGFDLGLANIFNDADNEVFKTRALNLFVTYQFGGSKE